MDSHAAPQFAQLIDSVRRVSSDIAAAHAPDVDAKARFPIETLAALRPDLIVVGEAPAKRDAILKSMRSLPGWKEIPAVREGRVVLIPDHELGAASHHVLKALAKLRAAIDKG